MIRAIIIDDEVANRNVLRTLLAKHCPHVKVVDEADNAGTAYLAINKHKPDLLFLDVRMPVKNGFDLLRMYDKIDFEIIFISAFNEYAISAFEFNALDYILKPIDFIKLVKAVAKATDKISNKQKDESLLHFIKTLDEQNELISKFTVHHNDKVVFVNISDIVLIESKTDFCTIHLKNGCKYNSSKDLKMFDDVLRQTNHFIRVNKSVLINIDAISGYTKGEPCIIELKNGSSFEISRRKKTEVISQLKKLIG
jgi:two-component system LytT family response regulator